MGNVLDDFNFDDEKPFIAFFMNEEGDVMVAGNGQPIDQASLIAEAVLNYKHEEKVVLASLAMAQMEKDHCEKEGEALLKDLGFTDQ